MKNRVELKEEMMEQVSGGLTDEISVREYPDDTPERNGAGVATSDTARLLWLLKNVF